MKPAPTIEVRKATKRFGDVVALDGVSLSVESGSCTALVGESGSGKSTLLRSINGMTALDEGTVLVRGAAVTVADPVQLRRSIGYVQQHGGLIPHWTVYRNAELVPRLLGDGEARSRASGALSALGLDPEVYGPRWPRELSGGQRQRVALARAVAAEPDILLLDEPFGALDAITRSDVQRSFGELRHRTGVTAVLVTHDLRVALGLATTIAVMQHGRIVQHATPGELVDRPERSYVAPLLERAGML